MKKYVLLSLISINLCHATYVDAMCLENQKDVPHICSDNVTSILQKIRSEEANQEVITLHRILDLAENGNEEAFQIILRLLDDPLSGIGYTIATDIFEKKFVSQSMVATLSKIEEVEEALIEIENGDNVDRIILERTGMKKYWLDVLNEARDGDQRAFGIINELLEKRYLLDLPFVIARYLKEGVFVNESMKKTFLENKNVQKNLKRFSSELKQ